MIHSGSATGPVVESYNAATSTNLSISGNTLSINPTNNFEGEKHYYVTFGAGSVNDLSDNAFAGSIIDFITQDIIPPLVSTVSPVAGAIGVAVGSNIDLTFNEAIKRGTGAVVIHSGSATGPVVESYNAATSANLSISGSTLTINPTNDLEGEKHYYVTFGADSVKDLSDNAFAGSTIDFTTQDITPPLVTTVSPVAGASGVAVGSNIALTFSEAIKLGTGSIAIHSGSASGTVVESYDAATSANLSISGNTLIINPTVDLTPRTHYYTTLDSGSVNDLSDNHFAGTTIDFTTADPYVPPPPPPNDTVIIVVGGIAIGGIVWWLFL